MKKLAEKFINLFFNKEIDGIVEYPGAFEADIEMENQMRVHRWNSIGLHSRGFYY